MKRGRSSRGLKNQGGPNLGVEKPLRRSKRLRSSSVAKPAAVERKRSSKSLQKARSSRSKATTRPAYVYEPVDTDVGEIRILTLLPGLASSEIQISLEIDRLSKGEVPQFEDLSYVWGSAEHSVEISVFTKGESTTARSLSVTQNLAVALLHLRGEKVPRRLWIDAICVDQRNLGERGRQVERMPEVYRSAERVVVWLGPERESSNLAMAAIRTLSAKVYYDQSTYVIKPFTEADENCASMDQNLPFDHLTMTAITRLFIRPWFERLWVQQEIRLAKDTSVIMCGAECILWPIFHNAMICVCLKPKVSPKYSALHNRCNFLLNAFHQNMFDISLKLSMTRLGSCRCLDPRDKIYAVLSLINTKDRNDSFKPDYKKSTAEVYKTLSLCICNVPTAST